MKTYVLMTKTGEEEHLADILNRTINNAENSDGTIAEFFVPTRKKLYKKAETGWEEQTRVIFPSYVFVSTDDIDALSTKLHKPQISLGYFLVGKDDNGSVMAVSEEEMDFIWQLTGDEISRGIKEGAKIHITSGPLMGMETQIKKVDPHKKKAWIEMPFLGEQRRVEVALDIIKVIK